MILYWLNLISVVFISCGIATAFILCYISSQDNLSMRIMRPVWTLTGLWAGVWALPVYAWSQGEKMGPARQNTDSWTDHMAGADMQHAMSGNKDKTMNMSMPMDCGMSSSRLTRRSVVLSALHCGAGCTLADIIGDWFTCFCPISIGGSPLWGNWTLNFILALVIGIFFQYAAIREMDPVTKGQAIVRAAKADILSLTAWQVGMYCWMALVFFVFFKGMPLSKFTWTYWFMVQLAMLCGFLFALPVNALLIKVGIKRGM